jgi:hypothetical protein
LLIFDLLKSQKERIQPDIRNQGREKVVPVSAFEARQRLDPGQESEHLGDESYGKRNHDGGKKHYLSFCF